ncbi:unnamed protein product, partial [Psylliodes chrysocephalus]
QILICISIVYLLYNPKLISHTISTLLIVETGLTCTYFQDKFKDQFVNNHVIAQYSIPIHKASKKLQTKIKKHMDLEKSAAKFAHVLTSVGILTFMPFIGDEYDITISIRLMTDYSDGFIRQLLYWYDIYIINLFGYYALEFPLILIKRNRVIYYQYMILNEMIENLKYEFNFELNYKNIIDCIKSHINLTILSEHLLISNSKFGTVLPILLAETVFLQISSVYFILAEISPRSNFRFIVTLIFTFYITGKFIQSGQEIKDASEQICQTIYNTDWYKWDDPSKKALLMMLRQCARPVSFSVFKAIDLDYKLVPSVSIQLFYKRVQKTLIFSINQIK